MCQPRRYKEPNGQSVSHIGPFTPVEQPTWYPLNWNLGGPQVRTGYSREEKYLSPLLRIELQFIQPTAFWLHQLNYPGSSFIYNNFQIHDKHKRRIIRGEKKICLYSCVNVDKCQKVLKAQHMKIKNGYDIVTKK